MRTWLKSRSMASTASAMRALEGSALCVGHASCPPWMSVPTGSPSAARLMLSPALMSKTMMGRSLSMHRLTAVESSTREALGQDLRVGQLVVARGVRVERGVGAVDAVHLGGLEQDLGADLDRAQGRGRVGREVGIAGARPRG